MKTTVQFDDQLLTDAKEHAARTGRTLTALLDDALRAYLARENPRERRQTHRLPTFGEGGLQPGVDLDNSAELLYLVQGPGEAG